MHESLGSIPSTSDDEWMWRNESAGIVRKILKEKYERKVALPKI
jgi:hypothetical protein